MRRGERKGRDGWCLTAVVGWACITGVVGTRRRRRRRSGAQLRGGGSD